MFCRECGSELKNGAKFCVNCGTAVEDLSESSNYEKNGATEENKEEVQSEDIAAKKYKSVQQDDNLKIEKPDITIISELISKEEISMYIWIGVVVLQALIGLLYYSPALWVAIWNAIACFMTNSFCRKMKENPIDIYKHYENALISEIIFLLINLFAGGVIGVVGAGYDLYVRNFAVQHKTEILAVEEYTKSKNNELN